MALTDSFSSALLAAYPSLGAAHPSWQTLPASCGPMTVPSGAVLFDANQPCRGFPVVVSGGVKVVQQADDGRRLELYRVTPGELCLVSTACLLRGHPLTATGITTHETVLLLIPPSVFQRWLDHAPFRSEVMALLAERMADLTALVDAVAFHKLDQRLAAVLLGHGPELAVTHQGLADQLGTVREIVTRLLRRFEQEGWVQLSRERIRILDSAALRQQAG